MQEAFREHNALQCGFCTAGILMTCEDLLRNHRLQSDADIRAALSGNLCRCTGYDHIIRAMRAAIDARPPRPEASRPGLIGARIRRLEDPRLLTGRGRFAADINPPGLLHVALRRSDHPHARIVATRLGAAAAMPGVVGVFDAAALDDVRPLRATSRMTDYHATELTPLARDKVRHVGEPVVAVVAENRYLAEDALELIEIDYEPLPVAVEAEAAATEGAPLLHETAGTNVLVRREFARGDVDDAFARAASVVGARFRMHRKAPTAIEPRASVAVWDAARQALTLHTTTQIPGIIRDALSDCLDLPGQRVRVVCADVGGGFGAKASLYPEEILVAALARRLEQPVMWCGDRLEDLTATSQAFGEIVDAELAVDDRGNLLGTQGRGAGRCRCRVDLSLDGRARAGAGRELSVRTIPRSRLSGASARRRHAETAHRAVSRRRPADGRLRHGAAARHGGPARRD